MTESSTPKPLAISDAHVLQQFNRAQRPASAEFLHAEIAQRMRERLKLIRLAPEVVLDAGCGTGARSHLLGERFPQARLISLDHNPRLLKILRDAHHLDGIGKRLARLLQSGQPEHHKTVCADMANTGLTAESVDLVWSNMALHWHPRPHETIKEWGRVLRPEGLAFFSCLGPATAIELRTAINDAGLQTAGMPFVDMHDFGDMLIEHGFADPVMDQETLTLTYRDTDSLLRDVRALGGNASTHRRASLVGRAWLARLKDALQSRRNEHGELKLTIEVSYGHAWRRSVRKHGTETHISLQSIGRKGPAI